MTEIYLIRHAEAEGNIFRRIHGQYNSLLTPRGFRQAAALGKRFENIPLDGCFASDLTRTCQTARAIYVPKGLQLHRDARFRERNLGWWDDYATGYIRYFYPKEMNAFSHDPAHWICDGAESYEELTDRLLAGLRDAAERYDGGRIAVVCHSIAIYCLLLRLFFQNESEKLAYSDNTAVSHLLYDKGTVTYDYLNDSSHLKGELSGDFVKRWWQETGLMREKDLYYLPPEEVSLPAGFPVPEGEGTTLIAMNLASPVGAISLGKAKENCGEILGITLLPEMEGRFYTDQLLGCAFSHFRKYGCTELLAEGEKYPENVLERYDFDPVSRKRSIDAEHFIW